jgi:formyltetrahydrofolate deformylase
MRVSFFAGENAPELKTLRASFGPTAKRYCMDWAMVDAKTRSRVLILVSRQGHCLNDLLYCHRIGALHADIAGIVSNHETFSDLAAWCKIPFYHLPVTSETKTAQEKKLLEIVEKEEIDFVVLARYMQILSPELCAALAGKCINIHHSFLPSFKGANPHRQAYSRGVKLIGATAH